MSAKTATVRLYVTLLALVSGLLALATALLHLMTAGISRASDALEAQSSKTFKPFEPFSPSAKKVTPKAVTSRTHAPIGRPKLTLVPPAPGQTERLTTALIGMGFRAPDVRRFVSSLGERVESAELKGLIVEGLRFLAPSVPSATVAS